MADKKQKDRTNRDFKSLHKPLTYLGVERTLFYFVCVGAVGPSISSTQSSPASPFSLVVLPSGIGVTSSDPASLRILARSERYKLRYDAAKQLIARVEVL